MYIDNYNMIPFYEKMKQKPLSIFKEKVSGDKHFKLISPLWGRKDCDWVVRGN